MSPTGTEQGAESQGNLGESSEYVASYQHAVQLNYEQVMRDPGKLGVQGVNVPTW